MSNIYRDSESLGKSNEKSGLRFEHFCLRKWSKISKLKKIVFWSDFAFQNMVETTLPDGFETSGQRAVAVALAVDSGSTYDTEMVELQKFKCSSPRYLAN